MAGDKKVWNDEELKVYNELRGLYELLLKEKDIIEKANIQNNIARLEDILGIKWND